MPIPDRVTRGILNNSQCRLHQFQHHGRGTAAAIANARHAAPAAVLL
jgi:hypothetical protein